jgi:predicted nucleic acid-binding protein
MRKAFLDTNIILDLLAEREPHFNSASIVFSMADRNELLLYTSSLSYVNTHYVLAKLIGSSQASLHLKRLRTILGLLKVDEKIVDLALSAVDFKDFEDAIQYYAAIEGKQDIIITRDPLGFKASSLPVMNCEEFLLSLNE